ncbi:POPLD-domain-containing protein [Didymella exigua CBS 183.55]|uniref:POPLD-domain-containing protein n=1 Tax=Didymella exigua CBS 183.55 TaxID=1150837 RepID=A0A6A5RSG9_9PLEO|nr:POPLD-domain-containing protein [Didymella exigua CBS 183.55]KAF1929276.1 POPLD-domain-containing protein [Didymella exigua CBS 183.55]
MADVSKKRKPTSDSAPHAKRARFPQMPARSIPVVSTRNAYPNGEVNVKNLLRSHENEIRSLEGAIKAAKKGLSRRAFQDVPRELRRRTASHNPSRVPKRLRRRARQEANEDNTPITRGTSGSGIGKGRKKHLRRDGIEQSKKIWKQRAQKKAETKASGQTAAEEGAAATSKAAPKPNTKPKFPSLATPATPPSRFRRRQRDKTWLPTHIWHTKRARMTEPKDPLWRFAIPLAPVVKAYRLTHRAAVQRGAIAWDMSYMSTIGLGGVEDSIVGLLRGLHFGAEDAEDPWQRRGRAKKWRQGTRVWESWLHEREAKPLKRMARVVVIWCASELHGKTRKAFIRVHPSAFLQVWNEIIRISKVQKPAVTVEDLRFEVGSIEIMGPAAAETLCSILHPSLSERTPGAPESLWSTLASVNDLGALPPGALLAFDISDPRLRDPPAQSTTSHDHTALIETLANWPIDSTQAPSPIFSRTARLTGQRTMPSQKSINRRQSANTLGGYPEPRSTDPRIPMLTFVSRESKSWTILLPWKCVMPVWRGIMRYPLSTGGNPRFGGLKERRQVTFERSVPSFPYDCPGTDAGLTWERKQQEVRKHEWTRRPKGKRIEWSTIDLGNGRNGEVGDPWACDWERLLPDALGGGESDRAVTCFRQLSSIQATRLLDDSTSEPEVPYLFTAEIKVLGRGYPVDCTRVYRLPTSDPELRTKWLSLMPGLKSKTNGVPRRQQTRSGDDVPEYLERRELASSLLEPAAPKDHTTPADADYPVVPDEGDLIGFVTTGNYNLAEGMPTAVANLALHRVLRGSQSESAKEEGRICIVREPGRTIGRLARWDVI